MSRPRSVGLVALSLTLLLLVALAAWLPDRGASPTVLRPTAVGDYGAGLATATAGPGRITPAMRAEVDRVVAAGRALPAGPTRSEASSPPGSTAVRAAAARAAAVLVRCAELDGQRYCLHTGWTTATAAQVRQRAATALLAESGPAGSDLTESTTSGVRRERTGDLDLGDALAAAARMAPAARAAAERDELEDAARSVAKVWLLRHQVLGEPLPEGFLERHPEVRTSGPRHPSVPPSTTDGSQDSATQQARARKSPFPEWATVMHRSRVAEQVRSYWCGPTTMQMIAWGWNRERRRQLYWARQLGTTGEGTSISMIVREINQSTGWDRPTRAGTYIVLDVGDFGFVQWLRLNARHYANYRAPVVLHPVLERRFFPYLDDDASGHFQAGRGYDKNGAGPVLLSFFEPWNQQRFDPSEPFIARVQWRNAYRSYRANQAHPQHNIGV